MSMDLAIAQYWVEIKKLDRFVLEIEVTMRHMRNGKHSR